MDPVPVVPVELQQEPQPVEITVEENQKEEVQNIAIEEIPLSSAQIPEVQPTEIKSQELSFSPSSNQNTSIPVEIKSDVSAPVIPQLADIANEDMYYPQDHIVGDVSIRVTGNVQKGSTLSKYTAYMIVGEDSKGRFQLARRYSEFDALRTLLKERWPGCFIATLPDKNLIKNSPETVAERERMLNDFLLKLARNTHIYYGDEVQLFLRAGETDVTTQLEKQPKLSLQDIINRYKNCFEELAGKEVNSGASIKISTFKTCLKKIQQQLPQLSEAIGNLAEAKDNLNLKLPGLAQVLQAYEKNTIAELSEGNTKSLIFTNPEYVDLQRQEQNLKKVSRYNPFWFFSDLIKIEQKDCQAFLEAIETIDKFNEKRLTCQGDIKSLESEIEELALGNSTLSSMTTRKSKEEVKKTLEEKNKKSIEEKHQYVELGDMVIALLAYMEIDNYKLLKKKYYSSLLQRLSGYEAYVVLNLQGLWLDVFKVVDGIIVERKIK